ncbi:MAG: hypothetical protein ACOC9V_06125 [Chloroflexota bacterium]
MIRRQIVIYEGEYRSRRVRSMFPAPENRFVARSLWVFLVENLRPGLVVDLRNGPSVISRETGAKVPIELYKTLMEQEVTTDE